MGPWHSNDTLKIFINCYLGQLTPSPPINIPLNVLGITEIYGFQFISEASEKVTDQENREI